MNNLNQTASADRIHIGFFGLRNAGKSSLVNAVTGQSLSVVSDVAGTTTDPVKKAMAVVALLKEYDYKGKGGDVGEATPAELMVELTAKILNM